MSDNSWETVTALAGGLGEAGAADAEELARGAGAADEHPYGTDDPTGLTEDIAAGVDLWPPWMELGGSPGQAPARFSGGRGHRRRHAWASGRPGLAVARGGSQVGQVIRRMTEGPRFADVGPTSMHGPAHGALDGGADRGAHLL
jgi:hypothetical protein